MPSRFFTSGRKFSTTTSAFLTMRLSAASPSGRLQIERHAALVAMQVLKVGPFARAAHLIFQPGRRLDLDDVGAPIGELAHAGRPRADAGEIENRKSCERFRSAGKGHCWLLQPVSWPVLPAEFLLVKRVPAHFSTRRRRREGQNFPDLAALVYRLRARLGRSFRPADPLNWGANGHLSGTFTRRS